MNLTSDLLDTPDFFWESDEWEVGQPRRIGIVCYERRERWMGMSSALAARKDLHPAEATLVNYTPSTVEMILY